MFIMFSIIFLILSLFMLGVSFKIFITKKPVIFPSRVLFMIVVIGFTPQLINSISMISKYGTNDFAAIFFITPLIFICLLAFFWIQMKGHVAIGIRDNTLRDALHHALNTLGLPFEEQLATIVLTEMKIEIQIAIQGWIGTAQIKPKKGARKKLMNKIIREIKVYFSKNATSPNYVTAIFYAVTGLLCLASTIFMVYATVKLDS